MINEKLKQIKSGKLSAKQNIRNFLDIIGKKNKDINAFLHLNPDALADAEEIDKKIKSGFKGKLAGLAIALKSNISAIGMPVTCASKTLKNYTGTFDADIVKKIRQEGGIIIGMLNMDEFACGISGETSSFGPIINPRCPSIVPGGSSSGSAAAVAAGLCDIALGSDTGGSIRNPASNCGICGIKPSYGRVSRYGLLDLSMSLDQIGPMCSDVYGCALMLEVISGKSQKDPMAFSTPVEKYSKIEPTGKIRVGISPEAEKLCLDSRIKTIVEKKLSSFIKKTSSEKKPVALKYIDLAVQSYYPIVFVEFFSGTRKFDGRKYGLKIEGSCGEEVLRRISAGKEMSKAEHKGKFYRKALQVRDLIKSDFDKAFEKTDIIVMPVTPSLPQKPGSKITPEESYAFDALTIPASLAGICAGVVPAGEIQGIPIGIQIIAPAFREKLLINAMSEFSKLE